MSFNKEESLFWLLAKKYSVIPVTDNLAKLNETEVPVKVNLLFASLSCDIPVVLEIISRGR